MRTKSILCGFVLLAALAACAREARAQGGAIDAAAAAQYFREARAACERDAGHLWGVAPSPTRSSSARTGALSSRRPQRPSARWRCTKGSPSTPASG